MKHSIINYHNSLIMMFLLGMILTQRFKKIDTALHSIASASGITEAQARSIVNESLVGAVFHDSTNGTGITSAQYSKLLIKSN